ncbi:Uncharacterized protein conserved in bacteria [Anoxybacillus flavithermus WK1]|uniref:Uncharacterized protein conserved in bacteria n=1 Tax=Anoxybacillus flavithermus (strain DSM 21510 / WK1) TaxID=491915 RepID=B7GJS7_ANOFW|nr:Uncharacterized protein conserved in bacteria [Anoxybacillus flavithermus WK1]
MPELHTDGEQQMTKKKNFPLRIDPKLYEIIKRWAQDEFRSVNCSYRIFTS